MAVVGIYFAGIKMSHAQNFRGAVWEIRVRLQDEDTVVGRGKGPISLKGQSVTPRRRPGTELNTAIGVNRIARGIGYNTDGYRVDSVFRLGRGGQRYAFPIRV